MQSRTKCLLFLFPLMLFVMNSCVSIPGNFNLASYSASPTNEMQVSPAPAPSAIPSPAGPSPTMAVYRLGKVTLSDPNSKLYVREGPGENYKAAGALCNGVIVKIFSEDVKDWDQIEFSGRLYYASSRFIVKSLSLTDTDNEKYYYSVMQQERTEVCTLPPSIIASNEVETGQQIDINGDGVPDGTAIDGDGDMVAESLEYKVMDNLVDVKYNLPSIELDLLLSGNENPAKNSICTLPTAFLQYDVMVWLRKAQAAFLEEGYTIRLYDAYRPLSTHLALCEAVGAPYLDPNETSPHCQGASVDITLIDLSTGSPVDMPCGIYEFCQASYRDYSGISEAERQNINYIESVMQRCGFIPNNEFWWQYDFSLYRNYMATDHGADSMILVRES